MVIGTSFVMHNSLIELLSIEISREFPGETISAVHPLIIPTNWYHTAGYLHKGCVWKVAHANSPLQNFHIICICELVHWFFCLHCPLAMDESKPLLRLDDQVFEDHDRILHQPLRKSLDNTDTGFSLLCWQNDYLSTKGKGLVSSLCHPPV